jgi:hypothetical protein
LAVPALPAVPRALLAVQPAHPAVQPALPAVPARRKHNHASLVRKVKRLRTNPKANDAWKTTTSYLCPTILLGKKTHHDPAIFSSEMLAAFLYSGLHCEKKLRDWVRAGHAVFAPELEKTAVPREERVCMLLLDHCPVCHRKFNSVKQMEKHVEGDNHKRCWADWESKSGLAAAPVEATTYDEEDSPYTGW